ncbi:uncharacterized protein At2g27730, mitochondrial isoform X2 [Malus sylvestris]|uniref:uncharacterized protein At2g27730, mitochondrial isoform X2 n=1 Tax=Malus sylvestris TaxID=3752 RepID=UPI0021ACFC12|nr:uncharacterized protein At2g27730, mitochondrial isoform X2 [Malus sylvestris]
MRSGQSLAVLTRALITRSMMSSRGATRYLSSGTGKILSEEERAAENVYIQRKERERLAKQKAEKEKAEKAKENADKKVRRSFTMFDHSS